MAGLEGCLKYEVGEGRTLVSLAVGGGCYLAEVGHVSMCAYWFMFHLYRGDIDKWHPSCVKLYYLIVFSGYLSFCRHVSR